MPRVFICGSALSGQPNHDNLLGSTLLGPGLTTPDYRMHSAQQDWHPAIYPVEEGGISIPGEVYEMTEALFTHLKEHEPPFMYPAVVTLSDGSTAILFMYPQEQVVAHDWPDISDFGGWANYMASKA